MAHYTVTCHIFQGSVGLCHEDNNILTLLAKIFEKYGPYTVTCHSFQGIVGLHHRFLGTVWFLLLCGIFNGLFHFIMLNKRLKKKEEN